MNPNHHKVAHQTRAIDAMAEAMRKRQRKLGKGKRKALIERALTVQFDKQQGRAGA